MEAIELRYVQKAHIRAYLIWIKDDVRELSEKRARLAATCLLFAARVQVSHSRRLRMLEQEGLRFLLDSLPDAVLICDEDGAILACNGQCQEILGYRPVELVGLPVEVLIEDSVRQHHIGFRLAYLMAPRRRPMQQMQNIRALRKDGTLHPVTVALSPAQLGSSRLTIVSIRDNAPAVAARARENAMYERLLRTQRMEDIGMVSCGIAHDFKNLLSIVLGNAELALRDGEELTPAQRSYMEAIQTSAAHLQELSNQMLAYAVGREAALRPVDLNEAIAEMSVLLRVSLPRGISLHCEPVAKLPSILAEPGHVAQVLLNLILNAREAIGAEEGSITVRTGFDKGSVFVEVEDDGCGIAEPSRERILDAFYTTKDGGRGLGLAVVKAILERYGGTLAIASREGIGSVFRASLPAWDPHAC